MNFGKKVFYFSSYLAIAHNLSHSAFAKNSVYNKSIFINTKRNMNSENFKYKSGTSSVAFVTAPDVMIARKLAKGLLEQKLAACVNIIPNVQSVYIWEGKLNEDNEYLMIVKTSTSRLEELTKWVRDNHPYSVAEVITVPIEQGNASYMKWLSESVPEKNL